MVGVEEGSVDGAVLGTLLGFGEGRNDGSVLGAIDGTDEGNSDGATEGRVEGSSEGTADRCRAREAAADVDALRVAAENPNVMALPITANSADRNTSFQSVEKRLVFARTMDLLLDGFEGNGAAVSSWWWSFSSISSVINVVSTLPWEPSIELVFLPSSLHVSLELLESLRLS